MPSLLLPPPVVEHLGPDNGTKIHNGTNHGDLSSMENSWRNHGEFMENWGISMGIYSWYMLFNGGLMAINGGLIGSNGNSTESQLGWWTCPNMWKVIKHVPNHQPDFCTDSFLLQAMDFLSIIKQRTDLVPSNSCLARNAAISFFSLWNMDWKRIPSGKHTKNYGKSPCYQWVNPLCAIFNSYGWLDSPQKKWENHRKIQETYGKNMEKLAMEV